MMSSWNGIAGFLEPNISDRYGSANGSEAVDRRLVVVLECVPVDEGPAEHCVLRGSILLERADDVPPLVL